MIVVNLPQFPYRGYSAPYLWMFYKFLTSTKGDLHFFAHKDYLKDPSSWAESDRWELQESSQRDLGYEIPDSVRLAEVSYSLMSDGIFKKILTNSCGNPLKAFEKILSEVVPELSKYYDVELKKLSKSKQVNAILSPINCPSLQIVAREIGIPLIHFELGPLRRPGYIDLAYFDFSGLNERSEFADRFHRFKRTPSAKNVTDLSLVRRHYLRGESWISEPAVRTTKFDVGVFLQIEDDTNLISSNNGFSNQGLIAYSKLKFSSKRVAYKAHPGSFFDFKLERGGVAYNSGTDFLFDCDAILTINSSMGFEALLWEKQVYVVGHAAYASIAALSDVGDKNLAICFYLQNYLVPFELIFNQEYIEFRLSNLVESDIKNEHITELLRSRTEEVEGLRNMGFERDSQISSLNHALTEGNSQIASLAQTVSERDSQITSLNHALTEGNSQIASLTQTVSERDSQVSSLNHALTEGNSQITSLAQTVSERDSQISSLNDETVRRGEWALGLDAELKVERAKLLAVTGSNSWRLTRPLREARRWVSSPLQQVQRYTKESLRLAKRMYQSLPLSLQTKARHRQLIAKTFPRLLQVSGSHATTIPAFNVPVLVKSQELVSGHSLPVATHSQRVASLTFPLSDSPLVSIIIPIYGQIDYTLRCLVSIAANTPHAAFEVIVVDDCSPDDSFDVLSKVKGIRLLRKEQNQGFIRSCNNGAKVAWGEYLYFLNNDTEVTAGWMDELLRTFSEFPGTGLAGSKLIYPDGRLQEAGGIIWQDGSAWNFGRFQDPQLPVYNYAREVDYCSGASIMVPKALFNELGGFDEHYLPAYCEDSDLALKIREKGYRVIYQPLSTVIHFEGITSGTDTTQGTKAYQVENSKKLFERWHRRLQTHQVPGTEVDKAKDRRAIRRVLVIDHCTPTPNQDAGSVTVFNLLLLLREMDFQVTFIPEDNFLYMPDYTTALQRAGIEVLYAPYVTNVEHHLKECGDRYDLAFIFRPGVVERHLKTIRKHCTKAKMLFHTVDLHFLRMSREAELQSNKAKQKAADEMKQRELAAIRAVDASIVHSTAELEILRPLLPDANLHVYPLIMNVKGRSKTFSERKDIIFVGGYQHSPNVDAVHYFVVEIMPLLRKQLSGVCFYAVGSKPPPAIQALASKDVIIAGFVEDLNQLLDSMRVSVAPLRYGAGIKGKIGTAMAVGLPVVATSIAAEGMSLTDGENICVADGAEGLAAAIIKIYQDEAFWNRISNNGLNFAEKTWGAEAAWTILAKILGDLTFKVKRSAHQLALYSEFRRQQPSQSNQPFLTPIASVKSKNDFDQVLQGDAIKKTTAFEKQLLNSANTEVFSLDGLCIPCEKKVPFLVDMESGGQRHANGWIPNWRERLECPLCRMNNRQRLVATLVKQELSAKQGQQVYFMEHVTPIFNWVSETFKQHQLVGSEYLGHEYEGGAIIKGIRHEDVENLSFLDGSLDLIVSNDVFEHVPNPAKAFAECARVLKPGGIMLATIPFHRDSDISITRSRLSNGQVEHLLPPTFHGNPVSADGSLVFTDFGWDLLNTMKVSGFSDVVVDTYASLEHGHLGNGQLVFRAWKEGHQAMSCTTSYSKGIDPISSVRNPN